jgi:hypothetical protein
MRFSFLNYSRYDKQEDGVGEEDGDGDVDGDREIDGDGKRGSQIY